MPRSRPGRRGMVEVTREAAARRRLGCFSIPARRFLRTTVFQDPRRGWAWNRNSEGDVSAQCTGDAHITLAAVARTHARRTRTHTRTRAHMRGSGLVLRRQSLTVATANIGSVSAANNRRNQCNRGPRHCSRPRCRSLQNFRRRNSLRCRNARIIIRNL